MKVCKVGINDMKGKWHCSSKCITDRQFYERRVYNLWVCMLERCYLNKYPTYKECQVSVRWRKLSNFISDINKLPNYDLWLNNPNQRVSLDKEYFRPCKVYSVNTTGFNTISNNSKERIKRCGNPMNDFTTRIKAGSSRSKAVEGTNIKTGDKIYFNSMREADNKGFNHSSISACCRGELYSHKGYYWKML